jgi:hypothetical protein
MPKKPSRIELNRVARILGIKDVEFVNKDFYVVAALKAFDTMGTEGCKFIFGGGTCLTKAFNLTRRMSEDVDLRIALAEHPAERSALKKPLDRNIIRHVYDIFTIYSKVDTGEIPTLIKTLISQERKEYAGKNPEWTANPVESIKLAFEKLKGHEYARMFEQYARAMIYDPAIADYSVMIDFVCEKTLLAFQ